ncbi:MAG: hypothetical protein ACO1RT_20740 [Planctomycetaceae bacterium]
MNLSWFNLALIALRVVTRRNEFWFYLGLFLVGLAVALFDIRLALATAGALLIYFAIKREDPPAVT